MSRYRPMVIDTETLPQDAEEHRAALCELGLWWPYPPDHALEVFPPVVLTPPAPAPSSWKDPAKIAERELANIEKAARSNLAAVEKRQADAVEWWRQGSLKPHRARVLCASWTMGGEVHSCTGKECEVVEAFAVALDEHRPTDLVGWSMDFDVGMLFAAALRHGNGPLAKKLANPHHSFITQHKLYNRSPRIVDAMSAWGPRTKLEHACRIVGIDHAFDNPIDGSQVLGAYMAGRDHEIIEHCEADVRDLWNVWCVLANIYGLGSLQTIKTEGLS